MQNIRFENFLLSGAAIGPDINQDSGDNGSHPGTSKMAISNIAFLNFTGFLEGAKGNRTAAVRCSAVHPCYNIALQGIEVASSANSSETGAVGSCAYVAPGGVSGLNGC